MQSAALSLHPQDLLSLQAELAEVAALRQRQEETLRQRERELTALKGALKDEVATHDQEMEALREEYSQDMEKLRRSMEEVSQVHAHIRTREAASGARWSPWLRACASLWERRQVPRALPGCPAAEGPQANFYAKHP